MFQAVNPGTNLKITHLVSLNRLTCSVQQIAGAIFNRYLKLLISNGNGSPRRSRINMVILREINCIS